MRIKPEEAISLLRKWFAEKRPVHCLMLSGNVSMKILGRIDSVDDTKVRLSQTLTHAPLGDRTFINFSVTDFSKLEYSDAADLTELAISKVKGHDALLTITYQSGTIVGLDVLAPIDELAQL